MARALVEDMLNAARSTSGGDHAYAKLLTEDLERARRQINENSTLRCSQDTAQSKNCWRILTRRFRPFAALLHR
ncbi:hypothetical protein ACLFLC_21870 [Providencia rettgeri]